MSLDISVPGGNPNKPGFSVQRSANGLSISAGALADSPAMFGVVNDEGGLSVSAWPSPRRSVVSLGPWTVYTFRQSDTFQLQAGASVWADVLLVGGGGSGGGGYQGGGAGAGGFLDKHGIAVSSHDHDVVVGAGGAEVAYRSIAGNQGADSTFAGLTAYGGGYGSSQFAAREGYGVEDEIYYGPSGGGSGGGGGPWPPGGEYADRNLPPGYTWGGTTDVAPWDRYQDPGIWQGHGDGALNTHGDQGHWGHKGNGWSEWYQRTAGGGGGAWWPAYGGSMPNGGVGRPCDITGWFTKGGALGALYKEANWRWVQWYGGGGGGMERPNNWGYMPGYGGYGGGGDAGSPGIDGKGGGAGGNGWMGSGVSGQAPGPKGGDGTVIIRIVTADESLVEYPVPTGYAEVWDDYEEVMVNTPIYPEGISVVHVPADQPHTDCAGEDLTDEFHYWGWPDDHAGDFPPYL